MIIDYAGARYRPRVDLIEAHADAWNRIGNPGAFWDGRSRVALVRAARDSLACGLCRRRLDAVSPAHVDGMHDGEQFLPAPAVELAHRLTSDPGRLTRRWFEGICAAGLSHQAYAEAVSVIATSVVIDTLHQSLGLPAPALPEPRAGAPSGVYDTGAVDPLAIDQGAWLPMAARSSTAATQTGLPSAPNIGRAMSLVPDAVTLFFRAFQPHYRLQGLEFAIDRTEIEFVASRVSALNQCFY